MTTKEYFTLKGENLLKTVKDVIAEGNVTRITVIDKSGKELANFPMTIGVVGILLAPVLAAIGAIAAVVSECSIVVEKEVEGE